MSWMTDWGTRTDFSASRLQFRMSSRVTSMLVAMSSRDREPLALGGGT